jgi:hypothetical protein
LRVALRFLRLSLLFLRLDEPILRRETRRRKGDFGESHLRGSAGSHRRRCAGPIAAIFRRRAPTDLYGRVLGVYELNKIDLLKAVFIWAYERSAARYAAVRQSLGEPNPFRIRYREQLRDLMADLVRARVGRKDAPTRIAAWSAKERAPDDRQRFTEIVEAELASLHEGNFACYRIRPSEFAAWRQIWDAR